MRLKTMIQIHGDGRQSFLVYDDIHGISSGIIGQGWTLTDAVQDFVDEYNRWAFFDDDTPAMISRDDVELIKPMITLKPGTVLS